ncbi:MAG: DUF1566 domain-containing protein [Deltaproteobacteria bacterium]|nr:DUF1566 domain-containing protein [Deltaproteobacteria bacterium]
MINEPSYTDNNDSTITDNNSGLVWQKEVNDSMYTWSAASDYCSNNTAALSGTAWRLPTDYELMTIVDYSINDPAINTAYFTNTKFAYYWSNSILASDANNVRVVHFGNGYVSLAAKTDNTYVRCVREEQSQIGSFTDNGNKTITDNDSGLIWQQEEAGQKTWDNALLYCEELTLAGMSDWRLPNIKELLSVIDRSVANPSINTTFFVSASSLNYWSSTTDVSNTNNAWDVAFLNGYVLFSQSKSSSFNVRCVRGGQ